MKPAVLDITREGTLGGETHKMGIADPVHIMRLLTDLYSDAELAVIREYSTNAWDSHVMAGNTNPIEITLPGPFANFFKVRDYGTGLSKDEVVRIYSQYGASTKSDSNDFNGMMGIGSKAALTYTNQFTVTAVKNGVKTIVSFTRNQDNSNSVTIVAEMPTTESNGVEVTIPAKIGNRLADKAARFYMFWEPGTVLVNGKQPVHAVGDEIISGIRLVEKINRDYIVMGKVAYPVKDGFLYSRAYYQTFGVIIEVPIGSVSFTPSREDLSYDKMTNETLSREGKRFIDALGAKARTDVDAQPNAIAGYRTAQKWNDRFRILRINSWKGNDFPYAVSVGLHTTYQPYARRWSVENNVNKIHFSSVDKVLVVENFTPKNVSQTIKDKVKTYIGTSGITGDIRYIHFLPGTITDPMLDGIYKVDFATDIHPIKLNTGPRQTVKRAAKYDVVDPTTNTVQQTDKVDVGKPIYFFSPSEEFSRKTLTALFSDATLVEIGINRWEKFKRDFPKAKHVRTEIKDRITASRDALTQDDIDVLGLEWREKVKSLDPTKVNDPELARLISLPVDTPTIKAWTKAQQQAANLSVSYTPIPDNNYIRRYKLLDSLVYVYDNEHIYYYLNAAYAAMKEN